MIYAAGLFAFIIVVWDLVQLIRKGEQATLSYWIAGVSQRYPLIPFAMGVLLGHLVWPNRGYC